MRRRYHRSRRNYRRRSRLSASNWGPVLALSGAVLGVLAVVALIVFVGLPKLLPLIGVSYETPFTPTPTPVPTPRPTPTPHPMEAFDPVAEQAEVVITESTEYRWFGDPYCFDGKMVLTAGKLVDSNALMTDIYFYDPETREAQKINITLTNSHFMFPKFNDKWLVYLDARMTGGGFLMACDLSAATLSPIVIKEIYTGQPEPMLDGDYVAWTDRTGTKMDKLFVCDLNTRETAVVQMFSNTYYGQSKPSLRDGLLAWADVDDTTTNTNITSRISYIEIGASKMASFDPGTYVHDPESDGVYYAWLDGHHSPDTKLYYSVGGTAPVCVDSGIVEFGLGSDFIAYGKDEAVWVYIFANKKIYRVTPERELTLFLGVSDDKVLWMDVTSRERDIIKYAEIP